MLADNINTNIVIAKIIPLKEKDNFVGIHSYNTGLYTLALVEIFKNANVFPKDSKAVYEDSDFIFTVSFLHDIGKLFILNSLLNKPSKLSDSEFNEIKKHSSLGKRYLLNMLHRYKSMENMQILLDAALFHHEKWDGNGYPSRIKGTNIPLIARIVAIADSFDAMTSSRPYSKGKTVKQALLELESCAEKHFDPYLINILLNAIAQDEKVFPMREVI